MTLTSLWRDRHPAAPPAAAGRGRRGVRRRRGRRRDHRPDHRAAARARRPIGGRARGPPRRRRHHRRAAPPRSACSRAPSCRGSRAATPTAVVRDYVAANAEGQAWLARFCADHGVDDAAPAGVHLRHHRHAARRSARAELDAAREGRARRSTWVDRAGPAVPDRAARSGSTTSCRSTRSSCSTPSPREAARPRRRRSSRAPGSAGSPATTRSASSPTSATASAATVVVATNMPILDRGGFFARAKPARSYGLAFRTPEPAVDGMYLSADTPVALAARRPRPRRQPAAGRRQRPQDRARPVSERQRIDELRQLDRRALSRTPRRPTPGRPRTTCRTTRLPFVGPVLPGPRRRCWSPAASPSGA